VIATLTSNHKKGLNVSEKLDEEHEGSEVDVF